MLCLWCDDETAAASVPSHNSIDIDVVVNVDSSRLYSLHGTTYIYTYIYINTHTCIHLLTRTYMYLHVHVHMNANRHFTGIIASCLMIYTTVLYFSVEIVPREGHFQLDSNSPGATALIVLNLIFGKNCNNIMIKCFYVQQYTVLHCTNMYLLIVTSLIL